MDREMKEAEVKAIANDLFESEEEERAGQMEAGKYTSAFVEPMAVKSVVLLGIPDIIASHGPNATLSMSEIVAKLPSKSPDVNCLFRILRFLVAKKFFSGHTVENGDGSQEMRYGLTAVSKWMVKRKEPSLVPLLLMQLLPTNLAGFHILNECVLEGGSAFEKANGVKIFDYASAHPEHNDIFNNAMANIAKMIMKAVLSTYEGFHGLSSLVDVGGGVGIAVSEIVKAYPQIKAFNYDLPHVVATAPAFPGVEHVPGSMFETIPSADAVFMRGIMHDWGDEDCIKVLRKCRKAIPEKGKVIIVEIVLGSKDSPVDPSRPLALDLVMLAHTPGGKERTEKEWSNLLREAGFIRYNIITVPALQSVIEAFPY